MAFITPLPMWEAPKDRRILGWCDSAADPYQDPTNPERLTTFAAHAEWCGNSTDGWCILEWGGEFREDDIFIPDWWFVADTDFEVAANPVAWLPMPPDLTRQADELFDF